jgi:hypothetical protein
MKEGSPAWVPDEHVSVCSGCGCKFTLITRRHHCRLCGSVICAACSKQRLRLPASATATSTSSDGGARSGGTGGDNSGGDNNNNNNNATSAATAVAAGSNTNNNSAATAEKKRVCRVCACGMAAQLQGIDPRKVVRFVQERCRNDRDADLEKRQLQAKLNRIAALIRDEEQQLFGAERDADARTAITKRLNLLSGSAAEFQCKFTEKRLQEGLVVTVVLADKNQRADVWHRRFLVVTPAPSSIVALTTFLYPDPSRPPLEHGADNGMRFDFVRTIDQVDSIRSHITHKCLSIISCLVFATKHSLPYSFVPFLTLPYQVKTVRACESVSHGDAKHRGICIEWQSEVGNHVTPFLVALYT